MEAKHEITKDLFWPTVLAGGLLGFVLNILMLFDRYLGLAGFLCDELLAIWLIYEGLKRLNKNKKDTGSYFRRIPN